ncbi:hypothetical protein HF285_05800 [Acidithiobacillus ferrooxidans F221]|uniref:hypothetical protein n=1 Tax=Acidithiobacillus ferrooxidans TaxID=920 RepID=UPI001C07E972|nr:hypothetical protein [Acidithiobacillus ferrooxidans]MBU2807793.1 hypothetical protein [Acidithiobacillus ferrooxidans F221]
MPTQRFFRESIVVHTAPDQLAESSNHRSAVPVGASPASPPLLEELHLVRRELGHLAAELRFHQASGEPAELDEWIFSLIFLEARLSKLAQDLARPEAARPGVPLFPESQLSALGNPS